MIVQEFVAEVSAGEYALVFLAGELSHALLRRPSSNDFRVNGQYGGTMSLANGVDGVDDELIGFGAEIVETFAADAVYVRVDVVRTEDGPLLMELEVNEPALGLHLASGSAARFARAILES